MAMCALGSNPVLQGPWTPSLAHSTGTCLRVVLPNLCTVTSGSLVNQKLIRQIISRGLWIPPRPHPPHTHKAAICKLVSVSLYDTPGCQGHFLLGAPEGTG